MAKINSMLVQRLKSASEKLSKMTDLAEMSSSGNLSSFSGVFRVSPLSHKEEDSLGQLLAEFGTENLDTYGDLKALSSITAEVKAINNQAAILHGERIKKAQEIFKKYRDGAFTAWLIATYGNRQTPYNFLQYYELYTALPENLHPQLESMPRQAVYVLASRNGPLDKKESIVRSYTGLPKQELLSLIRISFPLSKDDKRAQDMADYAIQTLTKLHRFLNHPHFRPNPKQKETLKKLLKSIEALANG